MKRKGSRTTALLLVLAMMVSLSPHTLGATEPDRITLEAEGPTITVKEEETPLPEKFDPFDGSGDMVYTIDRDYEQDVWIPLGNNTSSYSTSYYMTVDNAEDYPDLSMNFVAYRTRESDSTGVQGGYEGNPGIIYSGSYYSCGALLKIFAQEAEGTTYNIQVTFHNLNDGTTFSKIIEVNINGQGMTLDHTLSTPAEDGSITVTLTNNGDAINSLNVEVDDDLAPYAYLPKLIRNYALDAGGKVEFTVAPTTNLGAGESQSGALLVKGNGATYEIPVTLTAPMLKATSGEELAEDLSVFGQLTAESAEVTEEEDGSTTISFNMQSSKDDVGSIPVAATISTTVLDAADVTLDNLQKEYGFALDDDTLMMEDGSVLWIDDANSVVDGNGKLTLKFYQLIPQTDLSFEFQSCTSSVAFHNMLIQAIAATNDSEDTPSDDDPATAILKEFELEIDLSGAEIDGKDLLSEYSIAIEDDEDLKSLNNAPLPPKTKKTLIAYRQMELLLQMIKDSGDEDLMKAIEDAFNEGLPQPSTFDEYLKNFTEYVDAGMENAQLTRKKTVKPHQPTPDAEPDYGEEDKEDWSSVVIVEEGSQCTNRGSISSSFHTTDSLGDSRSYSLAAIAASNTAASKGIRVYYTGRIVSEDNYINFEPIVYDLSIKTSQGTQSIGTSVNTGLSELNIIELDATKIPMGEKIEFTRDYDINPGTHFVNTDNRFTIVYPADALVPVDASNVHLAVPDFDVYKKNIFLLDDDGNYIDAGIVGMNNLHVSISNRGARGGYYQLTITGAQSGTLVDDANDQSGAIYRYLPAFTTEVLELPINLAATTDTITVTVTDCSQRTKETVTDNNTASYEISARERQVPTISYVTPADNSTTADLRTYLNARLNSYQDVTDVTFTLMTSDETEVLYTQTIEGSSSYYSTGYITLEEGTEYSMKVEVSYLTGGIADISTNTLSQTTKFTTPANNTWATITLPAGSTLVSDPEWLLYSVNGDSYSRYYPDNCDVVKQEDETYALTVLGDGSDLSGKLMTLYDPQGRALYAGMIGGQGEAIDMTERRTLALDGAEFSSSWVSVSGPTSSPTRTVAVSEDLRSVSLPNIPVTVNGTLDVDGVSYQLSKRLTEADYDVETKTYTFSVNAEDGSSSLQKFTFTVPEDSRYNVCYLYKPYSESSYYNYRYPTSSTSGTTLTAIMDSPTGTEYEPFLFVYASGYRYDQTETPTAYVIPLDEYEEGMDLTELLTHTLTFTATDLSLLEIQSIEVSGSWSYPSMYAYGMSVACTPGEYTVRVSYTYDGISYNLNQEVDLTADDQTIDLSEGTAEMAQLDITWDEPLGYINLYLYDNQGHSYSFDTSIGVSSGSFRLPEGTYSGTVYCYPQTGSGYVSCDFALTGLELDPAAPTSVHLGADWTGTLKLTNVSEEDELTANDWVGMSLFDVMDADGNTVQSCYGMTGYIIFTPEDEEGTVVVRQVSLPSSFSEYYSFNVQLPGEPGTYNISFSFVNPLATEYVIVASAGEGGTISPSGNVPVTGSTDVTFTITPNAGYVVSSVMVDGTDMGARNTYTFANVSEDHTITANFQAVSAPEDPQVYIITASAGVGGTISPSGAVSVNHGGQATFAITPDFGYTIQSVIVDGIEIGARTSYTFYDVVSNHTITASFRYDFGGSGFGGLGEGYPGNGSDSATSTKKWPVQTEDCLHGKIIASPDQAAKGETVKLTAVPDDGYALETLRVLTDNGKEIAIKQTGENTYTFTMPDGSVVIDASFVAISLDDAEMSVVTPEEIINPFVDVSETDWFYDDVLIAYHNDLFRGVSSTEFAPNGIMSRAMFVTVLSRLETLVNGTVIQGDGNSFDDVPKGQWYTDAVAWAANLDVANGYGNGEFGKDDNVTREQACTFIMRYLNACGFDLTSYNQQEVTFEDAAQVSSWAEESVGLAQALGIIKGRDNGQFDPLANMTRAECAAVFHRLMDILQ